MPSNAESVAVRNRAVDALAVALWGTDPYIGWEAVARKAVDALLDAGFVITQYDGTQTP